MTTDPVRLVEQQPRLEFQKMLCDHAGAPPLQTPQDRVIVSASEDRDQPVFSKVADIQVRLKGGVHVPNATLDVAVRVDERRKKHITFVQNVMIQTEPGNLLTFSQRAPPASFTSRLRMDFVCPSSCQRSGFLARESAGQLFQRLNVSFLCQQPEHMLQLLRVYVVAVRLEQPT